MFRRVLTLGLLVFLLLAGAAVAAALAQPVPNVKTTARLEAWKAIQSGRTGSLSIAIMDNGRFVYSEGFGMADRPGSVPVDRQTLFNIGSVSKVYCATAIMLLVDEGKIKLDSPVTAYIPEFTMADERYRSITVRMLLNHSSGLPGGSYANSFGYRYHGPFLAETLQTLARSHLKHNPGELAIYCNDGFSLAEIIVERVTGKKYSTFLAERILTPLGLSHTGLSAADRPADPRWTVARYYDTKSRPEPLESISFLGSGGLSATAEDLCRFADSFSAGGKQLLSAASLAEIRKNQPAQFWGKLPRPMISYGLGWDFTELPNYQAQNLNVLGKSGGTYQYTSMLFTLPDQRVSVAVIATGPSSPAFDIALKLLDTYAAEKDLLKPGPATVKIPRPAQPLPPDLLPYEGYYAGDGGSVVKLSLNADAGSLTLHKADEPAAPPKLSAIYHNGLFYDGNDAKYYLTTVGQSRYLVTSGVVDSVVLEKIAPLAAPVQISPNVLHPLWLRRNVRAYEGSMSAPQHVEAPQLFDALPGYIDFCGLKKITAPTSAGLALPSMRDASELEFFEHDGRYWAWISGLLYMPADLAPVLEPTDGKITIRKDGYNEWRKLPAAAIIDATLPPTGRLILFSPAGEVLADSIWGLKPIFVPAGSYIEAAGDQGDAFVIKAAVIPAANSI
ncbi:MAG: beta-lactamase family protein [Veillonellaceae bacterium]|nr:beta-lactamase family protein [Veillonellaceae bacterium]